MAELSNMSTKAAVQSHVSCLDFAARSLGGKPLSGNSIHHITESIQLAERCKHVRRNPNTLKLFVNDRSREDVVFAEKIAPHCRRVSTFNMHVGNCAGLSGVKRRVEADLRHV